MIFLSSNIGKDLFLIHDCYNIISDYELIAISIRNVTI